METFEDSAGLWEVVKEGDKIRMTLIKPAKKSAPKKKASKKSKK